MPQSPSETSKAPRPWWRGVGFLTWAGLTLLGTLIYVVGWSATGTGSWADRYKPAANAFQMMVIPGWALLRVMYHVWRAGPVEGAAFANAVGWAFWWVVAVLMLKLRSRLLRAGNSPEVRIPSRRRFLVDAPAALVGLSGAGVIAEAAWLEPWRITVPRYRVAIRDLPECLDGLRAVQISDTHLGPRVPSDYLESVIARAVAMKPDVFLLTGDYIHNGKHFIPPAAAQLRALAETDKPVIGVLGNHDWYGDGPAMSEALRRQGVWMVDNGRVFLTAKRRVTTVESDAALCVAGFGDLLESVVQVEPALFGLDPNLPRVVLAHNPDTAEIQELSGSLGTVPRIDLMISGHTHGGQVALPGIGPLVVPSRYGRKYAGGLVEGPRFRVLISRGVGMSIVPVRFNVPPELVEITLTRA